MWFKLVYECSTFPLTATVSIPKETFFPNARIAFEIFAGETFRDSKGKVKEIVFCNFHFRDLNLDRHLKPSNSYCKTLTDVKQNMVYSFLRRMLSLFK